MSEPFLKNPSVERLQTVLERVRKGQLILPPFRLEFVWKTDQRLHLMDSVRQGVPFGSLFIWRTEKRLRGRNPIGPFNIEPPEAPPGWIYSYLLDGQQRLTTLFATLGRALWTRDEEEVPLTESEKYKTSPDDGPWELWFDLEEQSFVEDKDDAIGPVLPLSVLLDDFAFDEWRTGAQLEKRSHAAAARNLQSAFRDFPVPLVPLYSDDMELVQKTFKRINGGETPMDEVHLARALTWTEDFDLTEKLSELRARLPGPWQELPELWLLKTISDLAGEDAFDADAEKVATKVRDSENSNERSILEDALTGIQRAIEVHEPLGILGPRAVPYLYGFVFVAGLLARAANPEASNLVARKWLLANSYSEKLGNSPPHVLRALRKELYDAIEGQAWPPSRASSRSRKQVKVPMRKGFNFGWSRCRLGATALALCGPLRPDGSAVNGASRLASQGNQVLPQLLRADAPDLPEHLRNALQRFYDPERYREGIENRVVLESEDLIALRQLVLNPSSAPSGVLESHCIPVVEAARLSGPQPDVAGFFAQRRRLIRDKERKRLQDQGVTPSQVTLL